MKKSVIIIVVIVLALAVGVWILMGRDDGKQATDSSGTSQSSESDESTIITYTDEGFSPATLTVNAGTTVTVENNSSEELDFSSDKHPVHTDNSELNLDTLLPGETHSFTVTKPGTWGYHNHLRPDKTGTIAVQAE